jgi:hypothetical protein
MKPSTRLRRAGAALATSLLLAACGGGGDEDGSSAIRLLNATTDVESTSLYESDDKIVGSVARDAASSYASVGAGDYTLKIRSDADGATLVSSSQTLSGDKHYTVVAWGGSGSIKLKVLAEDEDAPSSGYADVRLFNATTDAGALDMYLTASNVALEDASPTASSVGGGSLAGYAERSAGTYRLRITGTGDKTDLRLDVPAITLGDKQHMTVIAQQGVSGVLVHALVLVQQGDLTLAKNTKARARLAAGVSSNGVAAAVVGDTPLSPGMTSPNVGNYVIVPSGDQTLQVKVNGAVTSAATTRFTAGADYTVLVYGDASSGSQLSLLSDDNRLPTSASRAKMRLVHGLPGYDNLGLSLNSLSVLSDVAYGSGSSWASVVASTDGNAIVEVTTPLSSTPLFTTEKSGSSSGLNIAEQGVYTMFMLGGNADPKGVLRKER